MDEALILQLTKERLGIKTSARDTFLQAIIKGVVKELEDEKGIKLDATNYNHIMFVCDYVAWRADDHYADSMPRDLQFRLHNLMIHSTCREVV